MHSVVAHKAAIGRKEQICVRTRQTRQRVKGDTINGREDQGGEMGLGEELDPIGVVVMRHVLQNYSSTIQSLSFIQPALTKNYHCRNVRTIKEINGQTLD
jgi:hypothetical protein